MKIKKYAIILFLIFLSSIAFSDYVSIYDIQYTEAASGDSPYNGQVVTTSGIVTGYGYDEEKYFISMPEGGAWKGIYVYDYSNVPDPGDEVEITATVDEYYNLTELTSISEFSVLSTGNSIPDAVQITTDELASEEMYEGVLVTVSNVVVTETPDSFNEWYVDDGSGECQIDDGFYEYLNPQTGDEFIFITGLVDYGFGYYGLNPRDANDFVLGGIGAIVYENYPATNEDVLVQFSYYDSCNVLLWWKTSRDYDFEPMEMTTERSVEYYATIPGQKEGTSVHFYITAQDTAGIEETFPSGDPKTIVFGVSSHKAILNIPAKPFNPYAGETFPIEFASKKDGKAILRIYNAEGKLVFTPQNIIISNSSGITCYNWNGRDKNNKLLPLGLYICYLEVIDVDSGKKKTAKAPIVIGALLK
ncbi:MAG: hypothetical protein K8R49_01670 [Candidatus Cloacimonetes bacterium]|nr:hypothetical protein [Candidatus Cloacimonadota bacterium]